MNRPSPPRHPGTAALLKVLIKDNMMAFEENVYNTQPNKAILKINEKNELIPCWSPNRNLRGQLREDREILLYVQFA